MVRTTQRRKRKSEEIDGNKAQLKKKFSLNNLIKVSQINVDILNDLLSGAEEMKQLVLKSGGDNRLNHKILASVFYEPSTRTSCSFNCAMLRLGGTVVSVNEQHSSVKKGESLEDTIRTMTSYADFIVLRHPEKGSAELAASVSSKPVINAGDGTGEHPTQALLDIYTIKSELGYIGKRLVDEEEVVVDKDTQDSSSSSSSNGSTTTTTTSMVIAFVGDLKNGRTVHSLSMLLTLFSDIELVFVSPPSLALPDYIKEEIAKTTTVQRHIESLEEVLPVADVIYMTRIQKERFESEEEYHQVAGCFCLDASLMTKAKEKMIVMHPLPRLGEIATDVDNDPRAAYFRSDKITNGGQYPLCLPQMENGMYMRMALLSYLALGRV